MYYACAYYRISNEDKDLSVGGKEESNSICNQRSFVERFVKENTDIFLCEEKVDDGFSGVNFNRPAFQEMMEQIKNKKINCVIVKDLSRFGRNYIETGIYIQNMFPDMGVRFIAINDGYDSIHTNTFNSILIPFQNLMNDSYSKDISIKIRSQFEIKQKRGDFIGSFAVYGYKKDDQKKNHLKIDSYAASVVEDIYKCKLEGISNQKIAEQLNKMGILSPAEYKKSMGMNYYSGFEKKEKSSWSANAIQRILTNECYLGHMIQGKKTTPNHKIKEIIYKTPDKWIRVEHTHKPIVKQEDFDLVQKILKMDTRISPTRKEFYLFGGFIKCGTCKENMVRKLISEKNNKHTIAKKYAYLICSTYKNNKNTCTSHMINENVVEKMIFTILEAYIEHCVDWNVIEQFINQYPIFIQNTKKMELYLLKLEEESMKLQKLKVFLCEDLENGIITNSDYFELKEFYEKQLLEIDQNKAYLVEKQKKLKQQTCQKQEWISSFWKEKSIKDFTRAMIVRLVDRIEIKQTKTIKIVFRFSFHKYQNT